MRTNQVGTRISDPVLARLNDFAANANVSNSQVLLDALESYLSGNHRSTETSASVTTEDQLHLVDGQLSAINASLTQIGQELASLKSAIGLCQLCLVTFVTPSKFAEIRAIVERDRGPSETTAQTAQHVPVLADETGLREGPSERAGNGFSYGGRGR